MRRDGKVVVKLLKALYGLKQSAKLWYEEIKTTLLQECGLMESRIDSCVFYNESVITTLHVDDLMITGKNKVEIEKIKSILRDKYGKLKCNDSKIQKYLGMILDFSISDQVKITMKNPIMEIIENFNITNTKNSPCNKMLKKENYLC